MIPVCRKGEVHTTTQWVQKPGTGKEGEDKLSPRVLLQFLTHTSLARLSIPKTNERIQLKKGVVKRERAVEVHDVFSGAHDFRRSRLNRSEAKPYLGREKECCDHNR